MDKLNIRCDKVKQINVPTMTYHVNHKQMYKPICKRTADGFILIEVTFHQWKTNFFDKGHGSPANGHIVILFHLEKESSSLIFDHELYLSVKLIDSSLRLMKISMLSV